MIIAVINEVSAADKNTDILAALEGRGHQVINAGMPSRESRPELTYIHTGLMAAIMLNTRCVNLVVGGCGTGQGFLNSVMQYPGVFCGHILTPLDAWLFSQINAGNCISLALNQGYGWAGDLNLKFLFDRLFSDPTGRGYPPHRSESQAQSRQKLEAINRLTHRPMAEILRQMPEAIFRPVVEFPGFLSLLANEDPEFHEIWDAIEEHMELC
jgi:ribose 5-phosphate isomerase RpiB